MEIGNDLWVYPYGKVWDVLENKLDEDRKDFVSVYVLPEIFDKVPLSTLEGYFVLKKDKSVNKSGLTESFSSFMPRYELKRENMPKLEKRFEGIFFPFENRYDGEEKRKKIIAKEMVSKILKEIQ